MSINAKKYTMALLFAGAAALSAIGATQGGAVDTSGWTRPASSQTGAMQRYNQAPRQQYNPVYQRQSSRESVGYEEESFYDSYIKGKLHVGVSYTSSSAKKGAAPAGEYYLGNLNNLKEEDMSGLGLNLQYDFCDYVGVFFANDTHVELSAWNKMNESTDGSIVMDGMLFQLILQYPFRFTDYGFALTPYVGFGIMDISLKWSYANWWHYGWSSPEDYKRYGHGSKKPHNGYSRWMIPEEPSNAFTFTVGLAFQVMEHLDIDLFYRKVSVDDVDATFHTKNETGPLMLEGTFPVEFSTLGLGLRYVF